MKSIKGLVPSGVRSKLKRELLGILHYEWSRLYPFSSPFVEARRGSFDYLVERACPGDGIEARVPPDALRGPFTPERFLWSGKEDVGKMLHILKDAGCPLNLGEKILELGCNVGRLIRHFEEHARVAEVWGIDVMADHIFWCEQYLSPPFHFATVTIHAHLPFEDNSFDFIYAGSVFTHIDDLADAWFLELRRVLRPGGRLYVTIHDNHSIEVLETKVRDSAMAQAFRRNAHYDEYRHKPFARFSLERSTLSNVFYDRDFLSAKLERWFELLSVKDEAFGYQSAYLMRKTERNA